MGADEALAKDRERAATVLALRPQAMVLVELDTREQVLAHAGGAAQVNFMRLRPHDRVLVELSPHDPSRGRILKLLDK
jgi:translation initiation factor IF-1